MSEKFDCAIVRRMILENPEMTFEELCSQYEGPGSIPDKKRILYQEKTSIRRKLKINEADLPRHHGRFNISGFIREFCSDMNYNETHRFCSYFGLDVSIGLYKIALQRVKSEPVDDNYDEYFEPDANQNTGPRARKKGRRGPKKGGSKQDSGENVVESNDVVLPTYESIENSLDVLIQQAAEIKDSNLVKSLKNARRQAGASILGS